jgi:hypothetical protein
MPSSFRSVRRIRARQFTCKSGRSSGDSSSHIEVLPKPGDFRTQYWLTGLIGLLAPRKAENGVSRISVIGCGYVGLVTGICLAELGHTVACTDNDGSKIEALRAGKVSIYEPHLDALVERNLREGRLQFFASPGEAVRSSETVFICVGTATLRNGDADLSAIDRVAQIIATEGGGPKLGYFSRPGRPGAARKWGAFRHATLRS